MRALITGGAGFIGSHLADALLERGHDVVVLDDLSTGRLENLDHLLGHARFRCLIDSVTNAAMVGDLMARADVVFHLAAAVGVRLVVDQAIHTIENNVNGTEVVLREASRRKTRVIVASTSEVYGKSAALPFREDADLVLGPPNKPRWGYAASKLIDEYLALAYWKERGVPTTVVRLFNAVGPRQCSQYGMVLPNFVRQALAGKRIVVHGDGTQTRCFTWIGDVVASLLALTDESPAIGQVFNIGSDVEVAIGDLARTVKEMTASSSSIAHVPYDLAFGNDFEDMPRRVPDTTKLQRLVGCRSWMQPEEIIARTIAYWRTEGSATAELPSMSTERVWPRPSMEVH